MKQNIKQMLKNEYVNEKDIMNTLFKALSTPNYLRINTGLLYDKVMTDRKILDHTEDTLKFKMECILACLLFMYDLHLVEFELKKTVRMFYHYSQIEYEALKVFDIHAKIVNYFFENTTLLEW